MLAIIDYRAGNLTSVRRGLDHLKIPSVITADPREIDRAAGIIFPGVGAAGSAMTNLRESGLDQTLKEQVAKGTPLLGICLGSQIILDESEENQTRTLGLIPGRSRRFDPGLFDHQGLPLNIPHMGWNRVRLKTDLFLFTGIEPGTEFYFVHSYYPEPDPEYCLGTTDYGLEFCSVLGREGLWAVQFHPEKSGRPGLTLLKNFSNYCQR
ncbi:MAG: imidazole glycerol phosphate synthase subunit HisH [Thermodesulfobacteriota bacterium]